jgi:hypothetical protein
MTYTKEERKKKMKKTVNAMRFASVKRQDLVLLTLN